MRKRGMSKSFGECEGSLEESELARTEKKMKRSLGMDVYCKYAGNEVPLSISFPCSIKIEDQARARRCFNIFLYTQFISHQKCVFSYHEK